MKMMINRILMTLFFLGALSPSLYAADINAAKIITKNVEAKYVSVFLVTGRQSFAGSFIINTVYKNLGTFESSQDINLEAQDTPRDGWRKPSHILVVIHNQKEVSLNKYNVMGVEGYVKPRFFDEKDYIAPTESNSIFVERRGLLIRSLNTVGSWQL